ncbi:MAG: HpcH/HpaI aldolase/citrate lyase family protein [Gammaproteobacteria bacterium]|nr:HpcH/HpaI aldolase/citrate lyase family protein [Gammaproteobacteria bacterium]
MSANPEVHTPYMEYLKLGASLYMPATHKDIIPIARGIKYPNLKSLIVDMEDSIAKSDLPAAYRNVQALLLAMYEFGDSERPLLFIRIRNPGEFKKIKHLKNIDKVDGFVLPKFHTGNMRKYMRKRLPGNYYYMPVLEKNIFDWNEIEKIKDFLLSYKDCILSIRIGGNDLLGALELRRDCRTVIYDIGIIKNVITHIVLSFSPHGFNITAPVYECFSEKNRPAIEKEVKLDLLNGLFGKTIVHPWQIDVVQNMYKVSRKECQVAKKLLDKRSPAVFKLYDQMHEKATHIGWARHILERAALYGING